jgi:RNA polymerase sigma factor (sigma-70 family)
VNAEKDDPGGWTWQFLFERLSMEADSSRDEVGWGELARRLHGMAIYLRTGNSENAEAEDAVSAVLTKLLTRPRIVRSLAQRRSPAGYVFVMLRNAALDLARQRPEWLIEESSFPYGASPHSDPSAGPEASAMLELIQDRLSAEDWRLLQLRFVEDLPIPEVAAILGATPGAVTVRLFRLLARVRKWYPEGS